MSDKWNEQYYVEREYVTPAPSPRYTVTVKVDRETYSYTVTGTLNVSEWEVRVGDRTIFLAKNVLKIERA